MIELLRLASEAQAFFESNGWKFCFIGVLANLRWGESRLTRDVDVALLAGFGREESRLSTSC